MSRMPRAGGRYLVPIKQTDGSSPAEHGHGVYTLDASTTYYYIFGGPDASFQSVHLTGYTSAAILTSASVQDCNHHGGTSQGLAATAGDVPDTSNTVGQWVTEDPSSGFVGADGTGWTVSSSVLAVAGTGVGGAMFHVAETGAARTRLTLVVGLTGGDFQASGHGKD